MALNPGLWNGLALNAHAPLGPTGATLRDVSGYRHNGTLTTMDLATDWVVTPLGWALDFDGTNDYVDFQDLDHWTESVVDGFTIAGWLKRPDITAADNWVTSTRQAKTSI